MNDEIREIKHRRTHYDKLAHIYMLEHEAWIKNKFAELRIVCNDGLAPEWQGRIADDRYLHGCWMTWTMLKVTA